MGVARPEGSFGARLRALRGASGLTQEELASRAGLSPNAVGALERGQRRRPYPHTVRALADALGLTEEGRASLLAAVPGRDDVPQDGETVPTTASTTAAPTPLPHPATPLVGRGRELGDLVGLLADPGARLVTLTGVGGVGKTRLATEAAREALAARPFTDGVAFVGLAPIEDPSLVVPAVLHALAVASPEGQDPGEVLARSLRDRNLLLVLDNFEHLLDAAPAVAGLVEACPGLVVLATSRAPLRVRGEREYPVSPLALPKTTRSPSAEEVAGSSAGALFVDRAGATSSGFRLTRENAGDVAAICWRLAGLPLALELAAAKTKFLDPKALLARLDRALSTAGGRDLPERQRTMGATLDWSYGLLGGREQGLLGRLSVFVGGFTLEAAEAVGATGEVCAGDVIEHLGNLVEQSLVVAEPSAGEPGIRYGMLEPVRQYALEKLEEAGESEETRRRHAAFYLALAERAAAGLWGGGQGDWLERLERENGNLRAALSWALSGAGDPESAARLCWALWLFWWARGHHREGGRWSEATLARPLAPARRARVLPVAAAMSYAANDHAAAEARWREGLRVSAQADDPLAEGYSRAGLGLAQMARGEPAAAAGSFGEALPLVEECGDPLVSLVRVWLGTTSLVRGDAARAEEEIRAGLGSARARGDTLCTYVALYNLAQLALAREDLEPAAEALEEGVELSAYTRDQANLAHFLEALSAVAVLRGEAGRSAVLTGAAEESLREAGAPVYNFYNPDPALKEQTIAEARTVLGEKTFERLRSRGRSMTFDEAVAHALGADKGSVPSPET